MEQEGLMENNRGPDLIYSNSQNNNNKQTLLHFTSISPLATKVIDTSCNQSGYAAAEAE